MAIEVVNRQRLARIDASRVARLGDATLGAVGKRGASLTVAFVRDRIIRDLNRKFRASDRATDVLSFPRGNAGDADFMGGNALEYLGDIVVSTDTALRQANEAGLSFDREVDELVMHGVLHLCGYDHEKDRGEMSRLELKLRRKLLD
ncbi:MAG: rRNA maturation RNase YbeY [Acidobacteriota bacterium]